MRQVLCLWIAAHAGVSQVPEKKLPLEVGLLVLRVRVTPDRNLPAALFLPTLVLEYSST